MVSYFDQFKHIHMVGIKGAGMTALAEILTSTGSLVTGSDTAEHFYTDDILQRLGLTYQEKFTEENITSDIDLVIYSTAYKKENHPELLFAQKKEIPLLSYPEAIGKFTESILTLAVCGTHGKTTTSSLLAETLRSLGEEPSALIGSKISQWEGSALCGKGRFFVLEADEYQNKLAYYLPFGVILTSVDYDHPDFFPTEESYQKVFREFVSRIPRHGVLVYNGDDAEVAEVAKSAKCTTVSYGFLPENNVQITNYVPRPQEHFGAPGILQSFSLQKNSEVLGGFELRLAGKHNAMNAAGVLALLQHFGLLLHQAEKGLADFLGTTRRFEYLGERFGALVYDDYAHHPEELRTTLKAFRELYPAKNIRTVFHPHTYTRTKALLHEFAQSFDDVDEVAVLPIYGSAREEHGGVSSDELAALINQYSSNKNKARVESNYEEVRQYFEKTMGKNDIIVSLGAGDAWQITHALVRKGNNK
jgi:UDP-N-acetylmuramate--alanine ligase